MAVNITSLNFEITTDPKGLGYAGKDNGAIARLLNAVGISSETIEIANISNADLQASVVGSEYVSLTAAEQRAWGAIVGIDTIAVKNQNIRQQVIAIWGPGTGTRSNLAALQSRNAARSEVLFGESTFVTHTHVALAL